jgi:hypothetical protein
MMPAEEPAVTVNAGATVKLQINIAAALNTSYARGMLSILPVRVG